MNIEEGEEGEERIGFLSFFSIPSINQSVLIVCHEYSNEKRIIRDDNLSLPIYLSI
jgi:hypothetical protein